ncbi:hypothetical protein DL763_000669 [Monosporascus cannonballus]|nr:hypothetical protein DL763_000669 [Monosporascus cannonballus]
MAPTEDAVNSASPLSSLLLEIMGFRAAATTPVSGLLLILFNTNLRNIASGSRLTWAWAKTAASRCVFTYMPPKQQVPHRSLALVTLTASALCLLSIGGGYVAFGASIPLSSLALCLGYAIAITSVL